MTPSLADLSWKELVEWLAARRGPGDGASNDEALHLAQELQVHQVELEMQNRELRDAQERLEASHARYADLYDSAPIGYATLDRNGIVLEINLTAAALLERDRDQLVGSPFAAAAGIAATTFLSHLRATERKGSASRMNLEMGAATAKRSFELTTAPYLDVHRRFVGFRMTMSDATERALFDAERRARLAADEANRMKDQFLGIVSHELRTPLNAMIGWLQILGTRSNDPALLGRGLRVMQHNGRMLARIVEDILDVSRIVSGKMRLEIQKVDLTAAVRAAVEDARAAASAKHIELRATLVEGLGVRGDAVRLQQVAANLLSNAIKFADAHGLVEVSLERRATSVRLTVRDDGCGIAISELAHVFEHFRQADSSTTRGHAGLGLGLAIARHIVEAHGGTIVAQSGGPGCGATFVVDVPERLHSTPPAPLASEGARAQANESIAGLRVLFVDDDADALELYGLMLDGLGAVVRTATTAEQAIELLKTFAPDVLVSDVAMPICDGFALIEQVRGLSGPLSGVPAIALTAYARADDAERVLRAGFTRHLAKPVEPHALSQAIAAVVSP